MKKYMLNKTVVMAILLAASVHANATSLSPSESNMIRNVLRALNIDESKLSNKQLEQLRAQGNHLRFYAKIKSKI